MKKNILLLFLILNSTFLILNSATAQWQTQTPPTSAWLKDIVCTDENTCFAVGWKGTIIRTTDGGNNWDTLPTKTHEILTSVVVINKNTLIAGSYNGIILKTTDAGNTWTTNALSMGISSIFKLNDTILYITGYGGGQMQKSIDGGQSWEWVDTRCKGIISDVEFTDINTGYAVETTWDKQNRKFVGIIIKTIDDGKTWKKIHEIRNNIELRTINFVSNTVGHVAGDRGTILKTTDAGSTWFPMNTPTTNAIIDIFFLNSSVGYAIGAVGTILKYSNDTWIQQTPPLISTFNAISVTDNGNAYIVGDGPIILKY